MSRFEKLHNHEHEVTRERIYSTERYPKMEIYPDDMQKFMDELHDDIVRGLEEMNTSIQEKEVKHEKSKSKTSKKKPKKNPPKSDASAVENVQNKLSKRVGVKKS